MEEHSLYGYLKRQTTKVLDTLLAYYLQAEIYENYRYVVLQIVRVLEERSVPETTLQLVLEAKEMLMLDQSEACV